MTDDDVTEESAVVDAMLVAPGHRSGRELADEALAIPMGRTEADMVAEEMDVLTTCMTALAKLPRLRRESVFDYVRARLIAPQLIEVLGALSREAGPVIESLQHVNRQLHREVSDLRGELRDKRKAKADTSADS